MADFLANQKVTYEDDSRHRNQGTLTIKNEDHTLGNAVRHQLLQNPRVRFAGYKKPHPLEDYIQIRVQTSQNEYLPPIAVIEACNQLIDKMNKLNQSLATQIQFFRGAQEQNMF